MREERTSTDDTEAGKTRNERGQQPEKRGSCSQQEAHSQQQGASELYGY